MWQEDFEAPEATLPHHHHDVLCACGHRHAEHSLFGSCHGCQGCEPDDDLEAEHTHQYLRCVCTDFVVAADVTVELHDAALAG